MKKAKKRQAKGCANCSYYVVGGGNIIKDCDHEFVSGDDEVNMLGELVANHFCHHWKSESGQKGDG